MMTCGIVGERRGIDPAISRNMDAARAGPVLYTQVRCSDGAMSSMFVDMTSC